MYMFCEIDCYVYTETEMILDIESRINNVPTLNSIKEKTSIAFLMGLNSTVNYAINEASKDFDGLGIDYTAANRTVGIGRNAVTPTDEINIQLKGVSITSTSMLEVTDSHVRYRMKDKLDAVGNHYIFVIILPDPKELADWCGIDDERLVLKAKGYYYRINGTVKPGFINIPITNKLSAETYMDLFNGKLPVEIV